MSRINDLGQIGSLIGHTTPFYLMSPTYSRVVYWSCLASKLVLNWLARTSIHLFRCLLSIDLYINANARGKNQLYM